MPDIIQLTPQGYCGGVKSAIEKVLTYRKEHPEEQMTVLGNLVHNRHVKAMLEEQGITVLEDPKKNRLALLDQIDSGTVVFTAHGVSDEVRQKAKEKGLKTLDASCPFVLSTQKIVKSKGREGYSVLYIGKKGHPEAEASVAGNEHVYLIETKKDIPKDLSGPIFVTNQTTMSVLDLKDLFDRILKIYPQAEIHDEICSATRLRQQAVLNLKNDLPDLLIVVGDPASNNTRKLEEVARSIGIENVWRIESVRALEGKPLIKGSIAITSGASTPASLKDEVVDYLSRHPNDD